MEITVSIPDDLLDEYEKFIAKYWPSEIRFDQTTGAALPPAPGMTVEEFIAKQIEQLNQRTREEFPSSADQEDLAAIEAIQARMKTRTKVQLKGVTGGRQQ